VAELQREAKARVLVADADAFARARVGRLLEEDGRFEICADVGDAAGATTAAAREHPDLCVIDVGLPGGGVAAAWEIKGRLPRTTIVMVAESDDDATLFAALRAGAVGYLPKDTNHGRLPHALADALDGGVAIPRALMSRVVSEFRDEGPRRRVVLENGVAPLTSREWQVLDLLRMRLSTAEMARRLFISQTTVRSHVAALLRKLDVPDREAAIRYLESVDR
jgi:two-component system nitrate/nitrite response regulator NarL